MCTRALASAVATHDQISCQCSGRRHSVVGDANSSADTHTDDDGVTSAATAATAAATAVTAAPTAAPTDDSGCHELQPASDRLKERHTETQTQMHRTEAAVTNDSQNMASAAVPTTVDTQSRRRHHN